MSIGANNDDGELRQRPGYRNTEFLITTGEQCQVRMHIMTCAELSRLVQSFFV